MLGIDIVGLLEVVFLQFFSFFLECKMFFFCANKFFFAGMDIAIVDLINIERFSTRVMELSEYRKKLSQYLCTKMENVAPNLTSLIGEQVMLLFIEQVGSLYLICEQVLCNSLPWPTRVTEGSL